MAKHKNKTRSHIDSIMNPQSAYDWALVAQDPSAPFHAELTQYIMHEMAVDEIIEKMELKTIAMRAKDAAEREWVIQEIKDKIATRKIIYEHHDHERHERHEPKPEHVKSVFELKAKAEILQTALLADKAKVAEVQSTITTSKRELNTIDKQWQVRQTDAAAGFVTTLNDQLVKKEADFKIQMKPSVAKKLEKAFITVSPAKILHVNPKLAESPDLNVDVMQHVNDFVRELKVLSAINHLIQDPEHKKPEEDFFPKPSQIKKLVKLVKVPTHTDEDKNAIEAALLAKKKLKTAQDAMKLALHDIHEKEKHLNRLHDEIRVEQGKLPAAGRAAPAA